MSLELLVLCLAVGQVAVCLAMVAHIKVDHRQATPPAVVVDPAWTWSTAERDSRRMN